MLPGGRIDPVGGLDQRGQQNRVERVVDQVNQAVANGVDAQAVVRLKVAGLLAERLGDVAANPRQGVQFGQQGVQLVEVDRVGVGDDVAAGQDLAVAGQVGRGDGEPAVLELLRDAGAAGEQVDSRGCPRGLRQGAEHARQRALRPQVLDHSQNPNRGTAAVGSSPAHAGISAAAADLVSADIPGQARNDTGKWLSCLQSN